MKKPDYRLKILNKVRGTRNNLAGAGWLNEDGSISIVVAPGVTLNDFQEHVITLFLVDSETKK